MAMPNSQEPFLKRWARRKAEAREQTGPEAEEAPASSDAGAPDESAPTEAPPEKRQLTEEDFADVDFDKLDMQSDYKRFLEAGVPEAIKRRALQQLWSSDPVFSAIEVFNEYGGDFTDAAVAVPAGTLQTAYKVGRGFLSDEEVAAWDKLGKPEAEPVVAAAPGRDGAGAGQSTSGVVADAILPPVITVESPEQPEARALLGQSNAYLTDLYPAESNHLVDVAGLAQEHVRFLLARLGGTAVGCGALVIGSDGEAEIKRMFVAPGARRRKLGRQILLALEREADAAGVRVIRLETGVRQLEALALYRSHGFKECAPFGSYRSDPLSLFFEKRLG